eukprot:m.9261 g.9261  ORF g.9261 m.9261 type:complete len:98 (+) comp7155_c0_seq1:164-457(+)
MPTTSKKLAEFVRENMKDASTGEYKDIITVAGVGPAAKGHLEKKGFTKAFHLLGQFLVFNMDEESFAAWLSTEVPSMSSAHRNDCYVCLKKWCENNL